jgi:hypothetical protein
MPDQPPKSRHGCFFYGCITGLILLLLIAVGGLVTIHYAKKALTGLVNDYTDAQPMALPTVQMSRADLDKLKERWQAFQESVRAKRATSPLVLTADEINALIASGPDQKSLKGKFYVSFDGNRVKGELSLPLQEIGWKMVRGRYLNGSGTFNLSLQNGVLFLAPQTIVVKGKTVPDMYMQGLRSKNFAADVANQPDASALLDGLQTIEVKDGKLTIVPKEQQVSPEK